MKPGIIGLALFIVGILALLGLGSILDLELTMDRAFNVKDIMQVGLSMIFLIAALFVILTKRYAPQDKHWAYGTIGTVVGYWLKG